MPTISVFYGIVVMMYLKDKEHNPPHIHAFYGDESATFYISDGEIMNGSLPRTAKKLVKEFITLYRNELLQMWETGEYQKLNGLE